MTNDKLSKYLGVATAVSKFSKDNSTQVGAVVIGPTGEGGPWGYNGAPRGCHADELGDLRGLRPEKYFWFSHAEANAIANAARVGYPLVGTTLVVTHFPCMDCAKAIVQAGIVKVVVPHSTPEFLERWAEHVGRSQALFAECGVEVEYVTP